MKRSQLIRRAEGWSDECVSGIHEPATDILELPRTLPFADDITTDCRLGTVRFTTAGRGAAAKINGSLARLRVGQPGKQRAALADDILGLICGMLAVFDWRRVDVRLDVANHQLCPKFHCDDLTVRLMTTYAGPGTEYVHRETPHIIHSAKPGSLLFLKGTRHPSHADSTLHRSPRLHEAQRRVSVVIDRAEWLFSLGTPSPRRTDAARHG